MIEGALRPGGRAGQKTRAKKDKRKKSVGEVTKAEKMRYFRGLLKINWEMSYEFRKLLYPPFGPHPEDPQLQSLWMWGRYLGELIWDVHGVAVSVSFDEVPVAADILIRALFEYFLKLHYLHGHPEEAEFQYNRGHFEYLKANPEMLSDAHNQAEWERLQGLRVAHPRRRDKSVQDMSRYFEERSENGTPSDKMYDQVYRDYSQLVHGTGRGLGIIWNAPKTKKELGLGDILPVGMRRRIFGFVRVDRSGACWKTAEAVAKISRQIGESRRSL